MTDRVAVIITNYNMPEKTDAICRHFAEHVHWPHDLIVVDNGSDLVEPSQFTTLRLPANRQTTGGWLAGLDYAGPDYLAYMFVITSTEFVSGNDPLTPMARLLLEDPEAVGVHPALTEDSTTSWTHLIARGGDRPRRTWMIDNIASLYRADWFDRIGRFDASLIYAWGVDLATCYLARRQGRSLWVHEAARAKKVTDIGYVMDRMNMSAEERRERARRNMSDILSERYGPGWWEIITKEGVPDEWR